ncbi:MAG: nickel-responsive transcriptional regulator NikR [Candidatus Glassbacteria bacterium]|nr:nickel-responsive transcriptional regulator NikR [Candidatus Glassbacteria bacterium]
MSRVTRFGVSIEQELAASFDRHIDREGYSSRSEAIRDLIRDHLATQQLATDRTPAVASMSLVYDHNRRELPDTLNQLQHEYQHLIVSSLHVHIDRDNCMEVVIFKGPNCWIKKAADRLMATRGVKHGKLTMTATTA